jgi:hypothetical protein
MRCKVCLNNNRSDDEYQNWILLEFAEDLVGKKLVDECGDAFTGDFIERLEARE